MIFLINYYNRAVVLDTKLSKKARSVLKIDYKLGGFLFDLHAY